MTSNAVRRAVASSVLAVAVALAGVASAERVRYPISGTITEATLGVLFPGRSAGETYHGSFTIDLDGELQSLSNANQTATYTGAFSVAVEGVSYDAYGLTVWSSGPAGIDDGFEIAFVVGSDSGYLSLRSSEELYLFPLIPTAVDLADMDFASLSVSRFDPLPPYLADRATITFVPEPGGAASCLAAITLLAARRLARSGCACRRREQA